ncbi:caspase family protein [Actinoplanes sp. NPDC023714]|uniref:caspase, EACC1-associated type n=1 Tax=Actinoplanes sp. NPDC023714 TaxID=3154322 RepID=UPI0034115544
MTATAGDRVPAPSLPNLRRHALVIANSIYDHAEIMDLVAPGHDAERMTAMLADPDICDFAVTTLVDADSQQVTRALNQIFNQSDPDDYILVYYSGHGIKDGKGRLYLATRDTDPDMLPATSVSARNLRTFSDDSHCDRQVVILDCCHSGAYDKGAAAGGLIDTDPDLAEALPTGRCLLTATRQAESAQQRRIEDHAIDGSVFTMALIEGILTGEADTTGAGLISVLNAYRHAYVTVRRQQLRQHPQFRIKGAEGSGSLILARNPRGIDPDARQIAHLVDLLGEPNEEVRRLAVQMLGSLALDPRPGTAMWARRVLQEQADGVDPELAALARSLIPPPDGTLPQPIPQPGPSPQPDPQPDPSPRPEPAPSPRPAPTWPPEPTPEPTSEPTSEPTPEPTPEAATPDGTRPDYLDDDFGYNDPAFDTGYYDTGSRAARDKDPDEYEPPPFAEFDDLPDVADPRGVFNPRRILPLEDEPSTLVARYLFPTERYRGEWKRHPVYLFRAIVVTGASAAGAYLVHLRPGATETLLARPLPDWMPFTIPATVHGVPRTTVLMWALIALAVIGLGHELGYATWRLVLTNKRLMIVRGLFFRRVVAHPLTKLADARFRQTPLGRLGGWGTLIVYSGVLPIRRIRYVPNPYEFYLRMAEETYEPEAVEARLGKDMTGDDDY